MQYMSVVSFFIRAKLGEGSVMNKSKLPDSADMPHWPAFNTDDYPTIVFGEEVRAVNDPNRQERLALARLRGS